MMTLAAMASARRASAVVCGSAGPRTRAATPLPGTARCSLAAGTRALVPRAMSSTACASGWVLPDCTAAVSASRRAASPSTATQATSMGLPSVSVPVLSNATTETSCAISSASASLMRMPWRAATPVPAINAVGVARPSAHGQAITSTATALSTARCQSPPAKPQASSVTSAATHTTGTNTALTRSTRCWMGAFFSCALSTSRTMRAKVDSVPTAVTSTSSSPSPLMAPPVMRSPGARATGRLSPVTSDSSTWLSPSATRPSAAKRSPGRTTRRSPTRSAPMATSTSPPTRRTRAVSGCSACSPRRACVVWRLARASSCLPSITSVMTTADASK